ncbi:MAG: hypothetical protein M3Y87_14965 [Myxococcota bacterium]|nr:hypothetical protein [Myxococcota bacterium]
MSSSAPDYANPTASTSFWSDATEWRASVTRAVLPQILAFGAIGVLARVVHLLWPWDRVALVHIEYTGALLVLLLVFRTNAGYDRWWEARKLWGGIVNQSRNLAMKGLAFGPSEPAWRARWVAWTATFPHAARRSLRGETEIPEIARLVGEEGAALVRAGHMPSAVALQLASLLNEARASGAMDGFAFIETDRERATLIDHIGGCERILRTPAPRIHAIKLRRFIVLYLVAVPFVIVNVSGWATPVLAMLVAYPLLAIDRIGVELENPFSTARLSHLPLDLICETIETNVLSYARAPAP